VDCTAVLDTVVKRKIPSRRRESDPRTLIVQPVAQRYTDRAITYRLEHCTGGKFSRRFLCDFKWFNIHLTIISNIADEALSLFGLRD
jgi:hypothetical protein